MRIDLSRLLLIDLLIVVPCGLLAWLSSCKSTARRITARILFYAIVVLVLAVPTVAVVWGIVALLKNAQPQGPGVKVVHDEKFTPPSLDLEELVSTDDLKRITLFDIRVTGFNQTGLNGFDGRVRNDLSRTLGKIGVKASFFNSLGQLVEVWTFWMKFDAGFRYEDLPPLPPNSPISFHGVAIVHDLPLGWLYQLEVIEAQYAN